MLDTLSLDSLQDGMEVTYRTADSFDYRTGDFEWSEWKTDNLYVRRRDKDLPKRMRHEKGWQAGSLLCVAVGDSAEFCQSDYSENYGYFDNGEGWKLQIQGLGDGKQEERQAKNKKMINAMLGSIANNLGPLGVKGIQIGEDEYEIRKKNS